MKTLTVRLEDQIQIIEMDYKGNSLTKELMTDLSEALKVSKDDENIRAVIITGKKIFSAGGDVFGMQEAINNNSDASEYVHDVIKHSKEIIMQIVNHPLPIIAAINRAAAGAGLSIAMACDHRLAADNSKLIMAFGTLALIPDTGASVLFPYRFNQGITIKASSTGEIIPLEKALQMQAIDEIVPHDELLSRAVEFASEYLPADRFTVAETKRLVNNALRAMLNFQFSQEEEAMVVMSKRDAFKIRLRKVIDKLSKK